MRPFGTTLLAMMTTMIIITTFIMRKQNRKTEGVYRNSISSYTDQTIGLVHCTPTGMRQCKLSEYKPIDCFDEAHTYLLLLTLAHRNIVWSTKSLFCSVKKNLKILQKG